MSDDLTKLAEACERAAHCTLWYMGDCTCGKHRCESCAEDDHVIELILAHARAIRAGRVTVNEGGER